MSLSYSSEHLAWQQRVFQEKSRASSFYKTTGGFYPASAVTKNPYPNANQESVLSNYRNLNYSLAYCFGGTKKIKNAKYEPSEALRSRSTCQRKVKKSCGKKYVEELKRKIEDEKKKILEIQKKTKLFK